MDGIRSGVHESATVNAQPTINGVPSRSGGPIKRAMVTHSPYILPGSCFLIFLMTFFAVWQDSDSGLRKPSLLVTCAVPMTDKMSWLSCPRLAYSLENLHLDEQHVLFHCTHAVFSTGISDGIAHPFPSTGSHSVSAYPSPNSNLLA